MICTGRFPRLEYLENVPDLLWVRGHVTPAHLYRALLKAGDIDERPQRIEQKWWRWVPAPEGAEYDMFQTEAKGPGRGAFAVTEVWL